MRIYTVGKLPKHWAHTQSDVDYDPNAGWSSSHTFEGPRGENDIYLDQALARITEVFGSAVGLNVHTENWGFTPNETTLGPGGEAPPDNADADDPAQQGDTEGKATITVRYFGFELNEGNVVPPNAGNADSFPPGTVQLNWTREYLTEDVSPTMSRGVDWLQYLSGISTTGAPADRFTVTTGTDWIAATERGAKGYVDAMDAWYAAVIDPTTPAPGIPNPIYYQVWVNPSQSPLPLYGGVAISTTQWALAQAYVNNLFWTLVSWPELSTRISRPVLRKVQEVVNNATYQVTDLYTERVWRWDALILAEPTLPGSLVINTTELQNFHWYKSTPTVERSAGGNLTVTQSYEALTGWLYVVYGPPILADQNTIVEGTSADIPMYKIPTA